MKDAAYLPTGRLDVEHSPNLLIGIHEIVVTAVPNILNAVDPLNLPIKSGQQAARFFWPQAANMIDHGLPVLVTQRQLANHNDLAGPGRIYPRRGTAHYSPNGH